MTKESFPDDLSGRKLSIAEVVEALDGLVDPAVAATSLHNWYNRKLDLQVEQAKYEAACNLVLCYDEVMGQIEEGGAYPDQRRVVERASRYMELSSADEAQGLGQDVRRVCEIIENWSQEPSQVEQLISIREDIGRIKQQLSDMGYSVD